MRSCHISIGWFCCGADRQRTFFVFFCFFLFFNFCAASHLGSLSFQRRNLQKARKVVPRIFSILDRQPFIDPFADVDLVADKVKRHNLAFLFSE